MASSITRFDIEKFDGKNDFGLCQIKMRALMVHQGCDAALETLPADMKVREKTALMKKAYSTLILCLGDHGFAAALAVLVTGASQSRQHESHHRFFPVDTSLIHIESRKSPTKSLFDVGSRRISIFTVNTKEYHSDVLAIITRIMRRT
ncbi:hypothetical protein Tco_1320794 [Tanacetum coccineum]